MAVLIGSLCRGFVQLLCVNPAALVAAPLSFGVSIDRQPLSWIPKSPLVGMLSFESLHIQDPPYQQPSSYSVF